MKNKIKVLLIMLSTILSLTSCSTLTNVVTKIDEEVEVTKIESTITEVYETVSKGCVGIVATTTDGGGSTGSGVVYAYDENTSTYYVVTNAHVVEDTTTQMVYLGKSKYYTAKLVGKDSKNDVAVLTFNVDVLGSDFEIYVNDIFNYQDNDLVVPGQTVLAIGCPLGIENFNILTTGVISSVSASKISTDASINPGNSGGGLFNMQGRLIGLNTEKEVWTTSQDDAGRVQDIPVEGRGYAITLSVIKKCINDIIAKNGDVTRPTLGLMVATVNTILIPNSEYKQYLPVSDDVVYFIVTEYADSKSNAMLSGVKIHDVILSIDGDKVYESQDITNKLNMLQPGDSIVLTVYRLENGKGKVLDITVTFR